MTTKNHEALSRAAHKSVDSTHDLFRTSLDSLARLNQLQLDSTRRMIEDSTRVFKDISQIKTPKDLLDHFNQLALITIENNINKCRDAYEIVCQTHDKISKVAEEQLHHSQEEIICALEGLSAFNPSHNHISTRSLRTWTHQTNKALNMMQTAKTKVSELASHNLDMATDAALSAVKKSKNK